MLFLLPLLFIGSVAAEAPFFQGWSAKDCPSGGGHEWINITNLPDINTRDNYCSDQDFLKDKNIKSIRVSLPGAWSGDLYAQNGCPFPTADKEDGRKPLKDGECVNINPKDHPAFRVQESKVPFLYFWDNDDCKIEEALMFSPGDDEINAIKKGTYCTTEHDNHKFYALDLPQNMKGQTWNDRRCEGYRMLQTTETKNGVDVGNRVCLETDSHTMPGLSLAMNHG